MTDGERHEQELIAALRSCFRGLLAHSGPDPDEDGYTSYRLEHDLDLPSSKSVCFGLGHVSGGRAKMFKQALERAGWSDFVVSVLEPKAQTRRYRPSLLSDLGSLDDSDHSDGRLTFFSRRTILSPCS